MHRAGDLARCADRLDNLFACLEAVAFQTRWDARRAAREAAAPTSPIPRKSPYIGARDAIWAANWGKAVSL